MTTSFVAGIDPGGVTGLVIVSVDLQPKELTIRPNLLASWEEPRDIIYAIRQAQPPLVFMERRASNPSGPEGLRAYEAIYAGLETLDYQIVKKNDLPHSSRIVYLLSPGLWKPFMAARSVDLSSNWELETQHEKDALALLSYGLITHFTNRKVIYA